MIIINRVTVEQIITQAKEHLPIECCGIIAGTQDGDLIKVTDHYPMTNIDQSPEHFSLDPQEQFKVFYAIREKGLKMLGNYHSHPVTPSRPSQEDIRMAYDPKAVYMILSLKEDIPVFKAFYIREGEYSEIPLQILD